MGDRRTNHIIIRYHSSPCAKRRSLDCRLTAHTSALRTYMMCFLLLVLLQLLQIPWFLTNSKALRSLHHLRCLLFALRSLLSFPRPTLISSVKRQQSQKILFIISWLRTFPQNPVSVRVNDECCASQRSQNLFLPNIISLSLVSQQVPTRCHIICQNPWIKAKKMVKRKDKAGKRKLGVEKGDRITVGVHLGIHIL